MSDAASQPRSFALLAALRPDGPPRELAALIVDDAGDDATLAVRALEHAGYMPVRWRRVDDADGMQAALATEPWDVVLCDHLMPHFDAFQALAVLAASGEVVPLIILSGAIGEEAAAAAILSGAADYVSKDHLDRLGAAVRRCLRQAGMARERDAAERARRDAEELFRQAFEDAPIGMALLDLDLRFVRVNDALGAITGYLREELPARTLEEITLPDDLDRLRREIAMTLTGDTAGAQFEQRLLHASSVLVWAMVHITLLRDADGCPLRFLAQIQDITDRRRSEERLVYLAEHDPLTGLLNRRSFERQLEADRLRRARSDSGRGAVILIDLDHFKFVNDTLGHHAGDEVIIRAARVLGGRVRETDVLARLGGDEFAVLLHRASAAEARRVTEALLEALRAETITLGPHERTLTASAGIATFASSDERPGCEDMLINADLAMYDAKNAGRDRLALYNPDEDGDESTRMKSRVTWAQRIGGALQHDGFTLLAQPIVDLATGRVSQHELLLRMRHDDGNLILPGSFLNIAERLGMVQAIDHYVTKQAITLLAEHHARREHLTLEINLSGLSIGSPELLELIRNELERTNVPPHNLIFEITETAAVINMSRARRFIDELRALGCRFALDDFGAGYGSFYYLKRIPFDFLKIDGEFVKNCCTSETDRLLINAAVDIAAGMGKRTIAEFVESEEALHLLRDLRVDYGQGFHLGLPTPLASTPTAAAA